MEAFMRVLCKHMFSYELFDSKAVRVSQPSSRVQPTKPCSASICLIDVRVLLIPLQLLLQLL